MRRIDISEIMFINGGAGPGEKVGECLDNPFTCLGKLIDKQIKNPSNPNESTGNDFLDAVKYGGMGA